MLSFNFDNLVFFVTEKEMICALAIDRWHTLRTSDLNYLVNLSIEVNSLKNLDLVSAYSFLRKARFEKIVMSPSGKEEYRFILNR